METQRDGSGGVSLRDHAATEAFPPTRCVSGLVRFFGVARSSDYRYLASAGVICIAILIAPALTVRNLTVHTNGYIASLQWVFVALMAPEVIRDARTSLADSLAFRLLIIGFLVCVVGWITQGLYLDEINRTSFYVVQPFFVLAASAWFQWAGDKGLLTIYWVKLVATAGAVSYLFLMLWIWDVTELDWRNVRPLPIYRHIRHLGYDLAVVACLGTVFWIARRKTYQVGNWMLFMALGYVSLRAAGRGQILTFLLFILFAACLLRGKEARSVLLQSLSAFALGAVVLNIVSPESGAWFFGKAIAGSHAGVTSGRTDIWVKVVGLVSSDWLSLLVGLGPEAFARNRVVPGLVQAHNAVAQILLEFGLIGLSVVTFALVEFVRRSWRVLRGPNHDLILAGAAASLAALFFYGLVDGIFYHASPFLASMLLIAFILARYAEAGCAGRT